MNETPLLPPEERFWKRYSPHQELPLAGATSVVLHGLAFGCVVLAGLALSFRWHSDAAQPPVSTVAFVEAAGGDGGSGPAGSPGESGGSTEVVSSPEKKSPIVPVVASPLPFEPFKPTPPEVDDPVPSVVEPESKNAKQAIEKAVANLQTPVKEDAKPAAKQGGALDGNPGGNRPGTAPPGTAKGPGDGGPGSGGVGGALRKATRAEILADRWAFNFGGSSKAHVEKLIATGITLGFTDTRNGLWLIKDLKRRPVEFYPENSDKFKDTVKWYNSHPTSVVELARELGLKGPPYQFMILLPKDREEKMAELEMKFTREKRRDIKNVEKTWFDFRLHAGSVEPYVIGQMPYDVEAIRALAGAAGGAARR